MVLLVQEKYVFRLLAGLSDQGFESGHYVIDEKDFTDLSLYNGLRPLV